MGSISIESTLELYDFVTAVRVVMLKLYRKEVMYEATCGDFGL